MPDKLQYDASELYSNNEYSFGLLSRIRSFVAVVRAPRLHVFQIYAS